MNRARIETSRLANAQIVDPKLVDAEGRCVFGATVDIESDGRKGDLADRRRDEADIKAGRISYYRRSARRSSAKSPARSSPITSSARTALLGAIVSGAQLLRNCSAL